MVRTEQFQLELSNLKELIKIQSVSGAMTNARNIINAASGMGDMEKLEPYVKEGLMEVRVKEHVEVKRKKMVVVDSGKPLKRKNTRKKV